MANQTDLRDERINVLDEVQVTAKRFEYGEPSPTGQPEKLKNFIASFKTDLAKPSRFDVTLFVPALFKDSDVSMGLPTTERLSLRCESASLPGRTLQTHDLTIYGPTEKFPYKSSYEDITLTFICSSSMIEKNLFDLWFDYINPSETWNFRYKRNYVTSILINQYDTNVRMMHQIQLVDAFPVSIVPMDLNWNDDGYHRLSVTFAYTYWHRTSQYEPEYLPIQNNINSPFYIENLGRIISGISLAKDVASNIGKNPWGILAAVGSATSLFGDTTLSALMNGTNVNRNRFDDEFVAQTRPMVNSGFGTADTTDIDADK
jgi:hypothetical protein